MHIASRRYPNTSFPQIPALIITAPFTKRGQSILTRTSHGLRALFRLTRFFGSVYCLHRPFEYLPKFLGESRGERV
jgi:hypothetical protein